MSVHKSYRLISEPPVAAASLSTAASVYEFRSVSRPLDRAVSARRIFVAAVVLGLGLRLIAVVLGDISPGGDGTERLALAIAWAEHPAWSGLSGVWPHAHWYFLGSLIRIWNEPIILAKAVNLICGIGAVLAFRWAVRPIFGEIAASLTALLLGICWTHIWLTSAYWVEIPFVLFVILAVGFAMEAERTGSTKGAFLSGLFLSLAILLRHEGLMLLGLFLVWYALKTRKPKVVLWFAALPVCLAAWYFVEPWLHGHSYFEYASLVREAKAGENLVQGFTLKDCLLQWVMMPAGVPSLFVVVPGLYGLWKSRRVARFEMFAWMFVAQVAFYVFMTFTSAWRPQLRYVMLYFVNLLPYAAVAWAGLMKRFNARYVLLGLVTLTILTQSAAWWIGRNNYRAMGWLPIETATSSQKALDDWVGGLAVGAKRPLSIVAIMPGPISEPWSLRHSMLVNRVSADVIDTKNVYVPEEREVLSGRLPDPAYGADVILIYPGAVFYPAVRGALTARKPDLQVGRIHPDIEVLSSPGLSVTSLASTGDK